MNILDFVCLREGFTPEELGLPDSVREGAGSHPLAGVREKLSRPMYYAVFNDGSPYDPDRYRARKNGRVKGAIA